MRRVVTTFEKKMVLGGDQGNLSLLCAISLLYFSESLPAMEALCPYPSRENKFSYGCKTVIALGCSTIYNETKWGKPMLPSPGQRVLENF